MTTKFKTEINSSSLVSVDSIGVSNSVFNFISIFQLLWFVFTFHGAGFFFMKNYVFYQINI